MKTFLLLAFITAIVLNCFEQACSHVINDCLLGEKYWCLSERNAKKCQKLEECFPSTKPDDYIIRKPIAEVPVAPDDIPVINHNPYGGYIG